MVLQYIRMSTLSRTHLIAGAFLIASAFFFLAATAYRNYAPRSIEHAMSSLSACFSKAESAEDAVNVACLNNTVDALLASYSVTEIMEHINTPTTPQTVAYNCHAIGHLIGHKSYEQAESLEDAYFQCTANCRNACIHGATAEAVQQEFGEDNADIAHTDIATLQTIGARYCERRGMFCHAIGHFFRMSVPTYPEALSLCDGMGTNKENCYAGVFMEDASAIESSISEASVMPAIVNDYTSPCAGAQERYRTQCFNYLPMYQNTLFQINHVTSSDEQHSIARNTCESFPDTTRAACFFGLGGYSNRLREDSGSRVDQLVFCESLTLETDTEACMTGVLRTHMVRVPPAHTEAFRYCERVPEDERSTRCFHAAFKIMEKTEPKTDPVQVCTNAGSTACAAAFATYETVREKLPQYYWGPNDE